MYQQELLALLSEAQKEATQARLPSLVGKLVMIAALCGCLPATPVLPGRNITTGSNLAPALSEIERQIRENARSMGAMRAAFGASGVFGPSPKPDDYYNAEVPPCQ